MRQQRKREKEEREKVKRGQGALVVRWEKEDRRRSRMGSSGYWVAAGKMNLTGKPWATGRVGGCQMQQDITGARRQGILQIAPPYGGGRW